MCQMILMVIYFSLKFVSGSFFTMHSIKIFVSLSASIFSFMVSACMFCLEISFPF